MIDKLLLLIFLVLVIPHRGANFKIGNLEGEPDVDGRRAILMLNEYWIVLLLIS